MEAMMTEKTDSWVLKNPYFLRKIEVSGLFSKWNICWNLKDVNVLVGRNGKGKSTLLRLIDFTLKNGDIQSNQITSLLDKFTSITLTFNNGKVCKVSEVENDINESITKYILQSVLKNKDLKISEEERKRLKEFISTTSDSKTKAKSLRFENDFTTKSNKDREPRFSLSDNLSVDFISTFDMLLLDRRDYDEYSGKAISQLDIMIDKEISRLASLNLSIINDVSKTYEDNKNKSFNVIKNNKLSSLNIFIKELNGFFNDDGKSFSIEKNGSISASLDGKKLNLNELSSGEKQILFLLLKIVNSSAKPSIIILDEPEISLHLNWQEKLISTIRKINKNIQIIIASHSPGVVMNGWMDCLVEIEKVSSLIEEFDK